jgi:hypothetical protein
MPKHSVLVHGAAAALVASAPEPVVPDWSPEQEQAVQETLTNFRESCHYVVLLAMMQSGKTKTFHRVIREMMTRGMIRRVVLLCGSNDVDLYKQAEMDAVDNNGKYCPHLREYWGASAASKKRSQKKQHGYKSADADWPLQVVFHQDMLTATFDIRDTLFILDESHVAQDQDMRVAGFFERHRLNLSGEDEHMKASNAYILSVSATPFSELALFLDKKTPNKRAVVMRQPAGHYGVPQYLRHHQIRPAISLRHPEGAEEFVRNIRGRNLYNIVRINNEAEEAAFWEICEAEGFDVREYSSAHEGIVIDDMGLAPPEMPTIILVKQRLRCGKVVPKRYVNMVWETSGEPNIDTILQSFLGRMCGYDSAFGVHKPLIYLPRNALEVNPAIGMHPLQIYVHLFTRLDIDPIIMPSSGKNVNNVSSRTPSKRRPVLAFCFPQPKLMREGLPVAKRDKCRIFSKLHHKILKRLDEDVECKLWSLKERQQIEEILLSPRVLAGGIAFRTMGADKQSSYAANLKEATAAGDRVIASIKTREGEEEPPVAVVKMDDGNAYVLFQLEHIDILPKVLRIPETTGKEMFNPAHWSEIIKPVIGHKGRLQEPLPVMDYMVASTWVGMSNRILDNIGALLKGFAFHMKTMEMYHKEGVPAGKTATATADGRDLHFCKAVFGDASELRHILRNIGRNFGANVSIRVNKELTAASEYICINEISWSFIDV